MKDSEKKEVIHRILVLPSVFDHKYKYLLLFEIDKDVDLNNKDEITKNLVKFVDYIDFLDDEFSKKDLELFNTFNITLYLKSSIFEMLKSPDKSAKELAQTIIKEELKAKLCMLYQTQAT